MMFSVTFLVINNCLEHTTEILTLLIRVNSLCDTGKMSRSFLSPEIFFVPYLTLTLTFIPNLTLPSNPLANGVN